MNDHIDKDAILIRLEIERAAFNSVVAQVNPRLIDRIMVQDNWTVKDILAHICAWELELLRWLEMAEHGEPPDIPAPGTWSEYMDRFNLQKFKENRRRTLADVQEEYQQVHKRLLEALKALPDDPHDPYWCMWYGNRPPWQLLATFYEHYQEHTQPIRKWLQVAHTRPL